MTISYSVTHADFTQHLQVVYRNREGVCAASAPGAYVDARPNGSGEEVRSLKVSGRTRAICSTANISPRICTYSAAVRAKRAKA